MIEQQGKCQAIFTRRCLHCLLWLYKRLLLISPGMYKHTITNAGIGATAPNTIACGTEWYVS